MMPLYPPVWSEYPFGLDVILNFALLCVVGQIIIAETNHIITHLFLVYNVVDKFGRVIYTCTRVCVREVALPPLYPRTFGPRSFSFSGPTTWNALPTDIRDPLLTLKQLSTKLKTVMFTRAYYARP